MSATFISVILPVLNAEKFISAAIHSILSQTSCAFELLVVDNGSTDGTWNKIQLHAQKDKRIRILQEPRRGIAYALNTGLIEAKGTYIARMDADDISFPERLHAQATFLDQNPETGLVSGLVKFIGDETKSKGFNEFVNQLNAWKDEVSMYTYRFVETPVAHPSVMFRKSLIEKWGPYTEQEEPEDYELWLRWFSHGVRIHKLNQYVLQWTDLPNRLSRTNKNYNNEAFTRVRSRYLAEWLQINKPNKPIYVWGGGKRANQKIKKLQELMNIQISGIIDTKEVQGKNIPHIHYTSVPPAGTIFILSFVSNRGKYLEIEDFLLNKGYKVFEDFILSN